MQLQRTSAEAVTLHFTNGSVTLGPTSTTIGDYLITEPGEYDVAGIAVDAGEGYAVISGDQQHLLVTGPELSQRALDALLLLEGVGIMVVWPPAGESEATRSLARVIADLEPRVVVVLGSPALTTAVTGQAGTVADRVKIQAADLEAEDRRVWVLD
jgi:hypothetical protein